MCNISKAVNKKKAENIFQFRAKNQIYKKKLYLRFHSENY